MRMIIENQWATRRTLKAIKYKRRVIHITALEIRTPKNGMSIVSEGACYIETGNIKRCFASPEQAKAWCDNVKT